MRLVYIAGPYRATTEYGVYRNIQEAERVALEVWKAGYAAICPHKNTAFFGGACPDSVWLEGDLEILRRCDAVLMLDGWIDSNGAVAEYREASRIGKPVFTGIGQLIERLPPTAESPKPSA